MKYVAVVRDPDLGTMFILCGEKRRKIKTLVERVVQATHFDSLSEAERTMNVCLDCTSLSRLISLGIVNTSVVEYISVPAALQEKDSELAVLIDETVKIPEYPAEEGEALTQLQETLYGPAIRRQGDSFVLDTAKGSPFIPTPDNLYLKLIREGKWPCIVRSSKESIFNPSKADESGVLIQWLDRSKHEDMFLVVGTFEVLRWTWPVQKEGVIFSREPGDPVYGPVAFFGDRYYYSVNVENSQEKPFVPTPVKFYRKMLKEGKTPKIVRSAPDAIFNPSRVDDEGVTIEFATVRNENIYLTVGTFEVLQWVWPVPKEPKFVPISKEDYVVEYSAGNRPISIKRGGSDQTFKVILFDRNGVQIDANGCDVYLPVGLFSVVEWKANRHDGWRPMDTAPKDGTEVLLCVTYRAGIPGKMLVGHYQPGGFCIEDHPAIDSGWYFWNGVIFDLASKPTHWHPLPDGPKQIT